MSPLKLLKYAAAGWIPGGSRHCVICGHHIWRFMPYRISSANAPSLMRALEMTGSDLDHFECPHCGSNDRERHLLMYMEATGLWSSMENKEVLHFAPERRLSKLISAANPSRYIKCDLHPRSPDLIRVDMLEIPFADETFDMVIANHVLEHVDDDRKALAEIKRVLKAGGRAILQTPFSRKLHHTWQDAGIADDESRLHAFGQEDHVRLFGRDIFERFAFAGLLSLVRMHSDLLPNVDAYREGVNQNEPFFLFQRADVPNL